MDWAFRGAVRAIINDEVLDEEQLELLEEIGGLERDVTVSRPKFTIVPVEEVGDQDITPHVHYGFNDRGFACTLVEVKKQNRTSYKVSYTDVLVEHYHEFSATPDQLPLYAAVEVPRWIANAGR